ncbi:hypothetical protein HMI49_15225 [Corallococcus exercitus]|uniref:Uncharacterized protein n=1 Tax=Corallococcus exercitus TaxID=2316736 RepID=A0A7Y4NSB3_9BACT|nr:hypothetical protein [Corallococcus exercitus]NOK34551.1 hypothetical protein [Corallococcus exercitus]
MQPRHVLEALGADSEIPRERVAEVVASASTDLSPFVFTEVGQNQLIGLLQGGQLSRRFNLLRPRAEFQGWRYKRVVLGGSQFDALEIPGRDPDDSSLPPTEAEQFLIEAWVSDLQLVRPVMEPSTESYVLVARPVTDQGDYEAVIPALFNAESSVASSLKCLLHGAQAVAVDSQSVLLEPTEAPLRRIFASALIQETASRRFMSLYRVLEHGYLKSILDDLRNVFFENPSLSIGRAQDALSSELQQLRALMERHSLHTHFEEIHDAIDNRRGANRFAAALHKRLKSEGKGGGGSSKAGQGAAYVYQVRCAIAHAGTSRIFIEMFPDSEELIEQIITPVEQVVHAYLKIKVA